MQVLYEDNHLIIVSKRAGEIVQGDRTGDTPLSETVKSYIKEKYNKPGAVFLGIVHRLDRPVSGVVLFARTSKSLARLNRMFAEHNHIKKVYWAIVQNRPHEESGTLVHWITRNEEKNLAHAYSRRVPGSKEARLTYRLVASSERYHLLEIELLTGRHHQIRCQLAKIGCPIRGDLKYGAPRSNPDGSISLHARSLTLLHPVTREPLSITAPVPDEHLWQEITNRLKKTL